MTNQSKVSDGLLYPFLFVGILWLVKGIELFFSYDFSSYGILPRSLPSLMSILIAPLIHGNLTHLISNSLPLLILGMITFNFYRPIAFEIFFSIYLFSGLCVWIVGEESYHIGASGLIYGFASFIFFSGLFRLEFKALLLAMLVAVVYGSIIWGLFPGNPGVSWQTHLYGALTGSICAYYYRNEK